MIALAVLLDLVLSFFAGLGAAVFCELGGVFDEPSVAKSYAVMIVVALIHLGYQWTVRLLLRTPAGYCWHYSVCDRCEAEEYLGAEPKEDVLDDAQNSEN